MTTTAPAWHRALAGVVGELPDTLVAPVHGPRLWWVGPLDVEGLALGSVQAAMSAANALVGAPRWSVDARRVPGWFDSVGQLRVGGRRPARTGELTGFFRCADGWIHIHADHPHHAAAVRDMLQVTDRDALTAALSCLTADQTETRLVEAGGVAAALRTPAQWLRTPTGSALARRPWIRFGHGPADEDRHPAAKPPPPASPSSGQTSGLALTPATADRVPPPSWGPPVGIDAAPYDDRVAGREDLTGLRVLDLTQGNAGAVAGRLLAMLGADVLRIDSPQLATPPGWQLDTAFGIRAAREDLRDPGVPEQVRALLGQADLLLISHRTGVPGGHDPDVAAVVRDQPRLAVVEIDAWGERNPWSGRRGFDSTVQVATGISHVYAVREPGVEVEDCPQGLLPRVPGTLPVPALGHATGYGAVAAGLALIRRRDVTGAGGYAHLSLARTAHELFRLPSMDPPAKVPPTSTAVCQSDYGRIEYVLPAVRDEGAPMTYPSPPRRHSQGSLSWR